MRSMLSAQVPELKPPISILFLLNVAMFQWKSQRFDLSLEKSRWLRLTKKAILIAPVSQLDENTVSPFQFMFLTK